MLQLEHSAHLVDTLLLSQCGLLASESSSRQPPALQPLLGSGWGMGAAGAGSELHTWARHFTWDDPK